MQPLARIAGEGAERNKAGEGVPVPRVRFAPLIEAILFGQIDKEPTQRQLYQIAEPGKPAGEPARAPAFMRLLVDPTQQRILGEGSDFRSEIMAQIMIEATPIQQKVS